VIDTGLADRVVLITGANSGIGAITATAFARQGSRVAVHFLDAAAPPAPPVHFEHEVLGRGAADAVVAKLRSAGAVAAAVAADLADPRAIPGLFDRVEAQLGKVEVLVNNAAHCETPDTVESITAEAIDRHFAVNTRAPVLLIAELVRRFDARRGKGGRVINISTDWSRAFAGEIAYGASKAALEAFTRSLAMELGPAGITVNAVAPGPVQTGYITPAMEREIVPGIPLRRVGRPQDVADAVVFLASDQARWITGQVIQVAGGHAL
jgi:3-oxoacyl-[acyl-carrier protein] reductase